ncbi:CRISPR-associated protein, Csh2 family [Caldanaerovirga acetigignens]|jgi:CRISPR-associated protein Csh2|uniref:CRISPR-associated protein, Csh2 family n=1 Tax=Caldanaerovirga acetigignens TaxID=447595 RepID=A0A1M7LF18_9FIRM|nr:type I-B CRISPR-associated protein Cas7/Csh2 [Caldanaerovirga acetigignens]SHM76514.1 CRISPR-associated protein, Csh2 family [Caldanaerovirga acetigignens]
MDLIKVNSEILYLYDARMCNPNGDPDDENKPRMDYETGRNLVSDVRLKRYVRDFWINQIDEWWLNLGYAMPQDVWVRKIGDEVEERVTTAKERIENLAKDLGYKAKEASKNKEFREKLLEKLIDVRCFGATMPIGGEEGGAGSSATFTGAVQFSWGYSLNKVELLPSSTISSHFAGRDVGEKGQYGTFGKDWRVKYSLIAFYGIESAWRARKTGFSELDQKVLDHSLIKSLMLLSTTRSKIGQSPQFLMRIEYKDDTTILGDLRNWVGIKNTEGIENIKQAELVFDPLYELINKSQDRINKVYIWVNSEFKEGEVFRSKLGGDLVSELSVC